MDCTEGRDSEAGAGIGSMLLSNERRASRLLSSTDGAGVGIAAPVLTKKFRLRLMSGDR